MKKLYVNLGDRSYDIFIGQNLLEKLDEYIKNIFSGKKIHIITDDNIKNLYGDKIISVLEKSFDVSMFTFIHGEEQKTIETAIKAYDSLIENKITRSDLIIAFGGGVVGDLSGFVASTYLRGVPFVQIPTSLLSMVDSSVGGKVGVDLPSGKNLVGSFYQPKMVVIDCDLLNTLPERFIKDGLGEVIKYSLIADKELFEKLNNFENYEVLLKNIEGIIYTCCDIKRNVVENDEFDTGIRMILNFGHTLGHAIEKVYGFNEITHGEGVCIGMNIITKLSEQYELTAEGTSEKIESILKKYELPYNVFLKEREKMLEAISIDKKNLNGSLNLILLEDIGKCYIHKSDISFFKTLY